MSSLTRTRNIFKGESMVEELIRGIDHVGVTVPDMEKATDFFKKVFGAKVACDNQKPVIASDLGVQHLLFM